MNNLAVRMAMLFCLTVAVVLTGSAQTGFYTLNGGTAGQTNQTYAATAADQSAVYVLNSGSLTLTNCTMTKSGDASNVNNSSQYGTNAGVLAKAAGTVTIIGGSVTTNAGGGNGLFASGSGSSVTMSNGTINASGGGAHGVDATYGGSITLTNVDVTTTGSSSSALTIDATSSWTVTAASNLSTLSDASGISGTSITNITGNGNNVYYDATLLGNSALGGKTYSLVKGGSLLPKGASAVDQAGVELPTTWGLQQNYPNPFNPSTMIRFGLPSRARATLTVFNYLGQKIVQLVDGDLDAGYHEVQFNGAGLASGLYLYTLKVRHLDSSVGSDSKSGTEDFVATKKFILMK